ncbi:hypothetical protein GCM10027566_06650 [Arachidicoccus ginsenosidivorans]|uniref:CapA family protein n=1 Tax=Arachidicoccus ginsenosidivorans TaxID=496057 RepID=A0A5B8VUW5_9BACT|nr:CapA family protein [Arachidicoccus ginsenosidivorans]QEC73958.1 CapA family protein [Arachidicoccus ginsenosidivorans]
MNNVINLTISGDLVPNGRLLKADDFESLANIVFAQIDPFLIGNDLNIVNLECPLTESNKSIVKTGPLLKAPLSAINLLKNRFNLVTLANNHILDYGIDGLQDTINMCENHNIEFVGAGVQCPENIFYFEKNGFKLGIINICENEFSTVEGGKVGANGLDLIRNTRLINEAKDKADFLILIFHGGNEYFEYPNPRMVDNCRFFIEQGVDLIVCHHQHCFSGFEKYCNGMIFYGIGNFLFDNANKREQEWNYGYSLKVGIKNDKSFDFEIIPFNQCDKAAIIKLLDDTELANFNLKLTELNNVIKDTVLLKQKWLCFVKSKTRLYTDFLVMPYNPFLYSLKNKFKIKIGIGKMKRLLLKNLIRCESHRDVLLEILKKH